MKPLYSWNLPCLYKWWCHQHKNALWLDLIPVPTHLIKQELKQLLEEFWLEFFLKVISKSSDFLNNFSFLKLCNRTLCLFLSLAFTISLFRWLLAVHDQTGPLSSQQRNLDQTTQLEKRRRTGADILYFHVWQECLRNLEGSSPNTSNPRTPSGRDCFTQRTKRSYMMDLLWTEESSSSTNNAALTLLPGGFTAIHTLDHVTRTCSFRQVDSSQVRMTWTTLCYL